MMENFIVLWVKQMSKDIFSIVDSDDEQGLRALLRIDGEIIRKRNKKFDTPLHHAIKYNKVNCFPALVKRSNQKDIGEDGVMPIFLTVIYDNLNFFNALVDSVVVDIVDKFGSRMEHYAAKNGNIEILKIIANRTQEPNKFNIPNIYGETPLSIAVADGRKDMAVWLIENGANVRYIRPDGKNMVHLAHNNRETLGYMIDVCGVDPSKKDVWGCTPMFYSCKSCNPSCINFLVSRGVDINEICGFGHSPIHVACIYGGKNLVSFLMNIDFNARNGEGNTAAHLAVLFDKVEVLRYLIRVRASMVIKNNDGKNPYELSSYYYRYQCKEVLQTSF